MPYVSIEPCDGTHCPKTRKKRLYFHQGLIFLIRIYQSEKCGKNGWSTHYPELIYAILV